MTKEMQELRDELIAKSSQLKNDKVTSFISISSKPTLKALSDKIIKKLNFKSYRHLVEEAIIFSILNGEEFEKHLNRI